MSTRRDSRDAQLWRHCRDMASRVVEYRMNLRNSGRVAFTIASVRGIEWLSVLLGGA